MVRRYVGSKAAESNLRRSASPGGVLVSVVAEADSGPRSPHEGSNVASTTGARQARVRGRFQAGARVVGVPSARLSTRRAGIDGPHVGRLILGRRTERQNEGASAPTGRAYRSGQGPSWSAPSCLNPHRGETGRFVRRRQFPAGSSRPAFPAGSSRPSVPGRLVSSRPTRTRPRRRDAEFRAHEPSAQLPAVR
jgi:hypothetical protein